MDAPSPRRTAAQQTGDAGEAVALALLVRAGLHPLARNVRFKGGELDLVMRDGDTLVFVEVRRRANRDHGSALDSVDPRKARKLALAAQLYLMRNPRYANSSCRFDVVAIDDEREAPEWVRHAFTLDDLR